MKSKRIKLTSTVCLVVIAASVCSFLLYRQSTPVTSGQQAALIAELYLLEHGYLNEPAANHDYLSSDIVNSFLTSRGKVSPETVIESRRNMYRAHAFGFHALPNGWAVGFRIGEKYHAETSSAGMVFVAKNRDKCALYHPNYLSTYFDHPLSEH